MIRERLGCVLLPKQRQERDGFEERSWPAVIDHYGHRIFAFGEEREEVERELFVVLARDGGFEAREGVDRFFGFAPVEAVKLLGCLSASHHQMKVWGQTHSFSHFSLACVSHL